MGSARANPIHVNNNDQEQVIEAGPANVAMAKHVESKKHEELKQHDDTKKDCLDQSQTQARGTQKIKNMGSFFTLDLHTRDHLWDSMKLKLPKYEGCESWVLPFPAHLNFTQLVIARCNDARELLDSRLVRIVFRIHVDVNGKEIGHDILLTPCSCFIAPTDLRLHGALMDAWWKLCRWEARLAAGEQVKLLDHLKHELQIEVQQKRGRTL
ncbi:hypothetical protein PG997_001490 [Apiospora hydei]|uniref:Uncharacterized protein n=1 Tax=Apiospora hydei TaxID=1337664 RepID=A0ABR1XDN6_9PEZI